MIEFGCYVKKKLCSNASIHPYCKTYRCIHDSHVGLGLQLLKNHQQQLGLLQQFGLLQQVG